MLADVDRDEDLLLDAGELGAAAGSRAARRSAAALRRLASAPRRRCGLPRSFFSGPSRAGASASASRRSAWPGSSSAAAAAAGSAAPPASSSGSAPAAGRRPGCSLASSAGGASSGRAPPSGSGVRRNHCSTMISFRAHAATLPDHARRWWSRTWLPQNHVVVVAPSAPRSPDPGSVLRDVVQPQGPRAPSAPRDARLRGGRRVQPRLFRSRRSAGVASGVPTPMARPRRSGPVGCERTASRYSNQASASSIASASAASHAFSSQHARPKAADPPDRTPADRRR